MSKKPSKTRKEMYNMPMHKASKQVASHLNEKLAKEFKKRSIPVRKGDTVKIIRGDNKGKEGKITAVNRHSRKIFVEKVVTKRSNGEEKQIAIDASKVIIKDVDRTDRKRFEVKKEKN